MVERPKYTTRQKFLLIFCNLSLTFSLNRLSSLCWILMIRVKRGGQV